VKLGEPVLLKLWMMEVVVTTGAVGRAKLQSDHHHQESNTPAFYSPGALPCPSNSVRALKGEVRAL